MLGRIALNTSGINGKPSTTARSTVSMFGYVGKGPSTIAIVLM